MHNSLRLLVGSAAIVFVSVCLGGAPGICGPSNLFAMLTLFGGMLIFAIGLIWATFSIPTVVRGVRARRAEGKFTGLGLS